MASTLLPITSQTEFERLYMVTQRRAYNLAFRLTGNSTDAEDVTQDAYVRAWHSIASYDQNKSFESWLFRIITNRVIDIQRRRKRVKIYSLDTPLINEDGGRELSYDLASPDLNPEQILIHSVMEDSLQKALAGLTTEYRSTIVHSDIEEMSYQEIADSMQCAIGTVRSRLHRARRILRKALVKENLFDMSVTSKQRKCTVSANKQPRRSRQAAYKPI